MSASVGGDGTDASALRIGLRVGLLRCGVVGQEDLFEILLAAEDVQHRVARRELDDVVDRSLDREIQDLAVGPSLDHAGQAPEVVGRYRRLEVELELAARLALQGLDLRDHRDPSLADDADPVGDALDLGQDMGREEDRPAISADLVEDPVELLLDQRIEAGRRLVEDDQAGPMHEGLDETHLLLVAVRERLDRPIQLGVEALGELLGVGQVLHAAERREVAQQVATGHARVERHLAGEVADVAPELDGRTVCRVAQDAGRALRRTNEVQEQADGGRLSRAVGPEVAEDLALPDLEVDVDDAALAAVGLGQSLGPDGRGVRGGTRHGATILWAPGPARRRVRAILPGASTRASQGAPWGCSSAGRAPRSHRGGQGFESPHLHQSSSRLLEEREVLCLGDLVGRWRGDVERGVVVAELQAHGSASALTLRRHGHGAEPEAVLLEQEVHDGRSTELGHRR